MSFIEMSCFLILIFLLSMKNLCPSSSFPCEENETYVSSKWIFSCSSWWKRWCHEKRFVYWKGLRRHLPVIIIIITVITYLWKFKLSSSLLNFDDHIHFVKWSKTKIERERCSGENDSPWKQWTTSTLKRDVTTRRLKTTICSLGCQEICIPDVDKEQGHLSPWQEKGVWKFSLKSSL